jgi:NAD-dependent DNA ligase
MDVPADQALALLDDARHALPPAVQQATTLRVRDRVVFTGDMTMSRTEIEALATAAGLRVITSVSAQTALVVADPYSQSGKAKRAREFGLRMVTERVFLHMLNHMPPPKDATPARPGTPTASAS